MKTWVFWAIALLFIVITYGVHVENDISLTKSALVALAIMFSVAIIPAAFFFARRAIKDRRTPPQDDDSHYDWR